MKEGVIKFNCHWIEALPLEAASVEKLNAWRRRLYALGLIGVTKNGIGYGNISLRSGKNQFIITGSGTGKLEMLSAAHYTKVTDYNLEQNSVTAVGPVIASSESLTHAAVYSAQKNINAVFHVHHPGLWKKLLQTLPSTENAISYGTPQMAGEVMRLLQEKTYKSMRIFAMGGHEDGIVAFGKDPDETGQLLLDQLDNL